jgi:hypothetical protein
MKSLQRNIEFSLVKGFIKLTWPLEISMEPKNDLKNFIVLLSGINA